MDRLSIFDLGSLNENKKITAKFTKYEVDHRRDGTYICALLEEGQLPEWQEGYGLDGQKLLLSLCNLYLKIENIDEWEACHHIIAWCKANAFPYCSQGLKVQEYDWELLQDSERWELWVNVLNGYEFTLERITADLKRLYEDMEILLHFYNVKNQLESQRELPQNKRVWEYANIASLPEMQLLYKLDNFLSELPKFPLELTLDEVGELKILLGFTSVFDAAYYALARFVATQPEVPTKEDGGKTPLGICESCGKIFFKNGNRQKYCDDPECKKERNRRKAKSAYYRKLQAQANKEWHK